jgi:hypothetical protein
VPVPKVLGAARPEVADGLRPEEPVEDRPEEALLRAEPLRDEAPAVAGLVADGGERRALVAAVGRSGGSRDNVDGARGGDDAQAAAGAAVGVGGVR